MKKAAFLENTRLLWKAFGIVPLLYGSLGLEYLTGENLHADDIDILIPEVFLHDRWCKFQNVLANSEYTLTDAHEHAFKKDGITYTYASMEDLQTFDGIPIEEIPQCTCDTVNFRLLSLEQYQRVYAAASKDGYRLEVRQKKDADKLTIIQKHLKSL